jgi:hypothetical protein
MFDDFWNKSSVMDFTAVDWVDSIGSKHSAKLLARSHIPWSCHNHRLPSMTLIQCARAAYDSCQCSEEPANHLLILVGQIAAFKRFCTVSCLHVLKSIGLQIRRSARAGGQRDQHWG